MAGVDEAEQTPPAQTPTAAAPAGEQAPGQGRPAPEPTSEQGPGQGPPAPEPNEQAPGQGPPAPEPNEQAPGQGPPATEPASEPAPQSPGFGERGRMRRRARFLRKARELAYRDLGGLVFDLHRFGQRNDQLVLAKLASLRQIDTEVRELEQALRDRRPVTVLREVGIAACPRCAAIHGSDDRFCPGCGLAFDTHADRPISTAPVSPPAPTTALAPTATPATAQLTGRMSPIAAPPGLPPAQGPPSSSPPPTMEPAPPVKPTAAPVAAKPASTPPAPRHGEPAPERREPDRAEEDEPTQILRPPATGA